MMMMQPLHVLKNIIIKALHGPTARTEASVTTPEEAVEQMRLRGIDNPESLLSHATPDVIINTCRWFDKKTNAKPGLLAWQIRGGGVKEEDAESKPSKRVLLEAEFAAQLQRTPVGEPVESHRRLARRKWPDEECECSGLMRVFAASFPVLETECDGCGLEMGYPVKAFSLLPNPKARLSVVR